MRWPLVWTTLLLAACHASEPRPAVLVEPDAAARAEVKAFVAKALRREDVLIAPNALTQTNSLIIERRRPRSLDGRMMQGREVGRPERFELTAVGNKCVLTHMSAAGDSTKLHAQCQVLGN